MRITFIYFFLLFLLFCSGCTEAVKVSRFEDTLPEIYPDYKDVTVPVNIAPLNFKLTSDHTAACILIRMDDEVETIHERNGQFTIPPSYWKTLLRKSEERSVEIMVCVKEGGEWVGLQSFLIHVSEDPADPYIAYRLIEPGYVLWNEMGIYQRNIENYTESAIIENKMTGKNCMNCHSFPNRNPHKMLFHMRGKLASTVLVDGNKVEKLNTKTEQTISSLVYPSWHPSEKYIAFSVNDTKQGFHTHDKNLIEVYDNKSDVVIYDVEKHEIFTAPQLFSEAAFESFPTFSPDGETLYFCTSDSCSMPGDYEQVKYSLCALSFDPHTRKFGDYVDTLFNAREEGKSVSFPRVSPDGKFILYGKANYGGFLIWHKEADLHMYSLLTGEHYPLEKANSPDAESYHSWSSNSRWITFVSRRMDGLYSRIYMAHVDKNGRCGKAFLLPQKDVDFYDKFVKSYNIPEFVSGKVENQSYHIVDEVKKNSGINLNFVKQ